LHTSQIRSLGAHLKRWVAELNCCTDSPQLDAEVLLKHVTTYSAVELITRAADALDELSVAAVDRLIAKRLKGVPVAYLVGQREFYSLSLQVSPAVLIPRPDTECLVETALAHIKSLSVQRVLDLGTGSGAIALALAAHAPELAITATDKSAEALEQATQNAQQTGLTGVQFLTSDWYQSLVDERFDLIVSNPPYIDAGDPHLQQGDVRFEPLSALVSAENGLADLRRIVEDAPGHLLEGGCLMLEHGYDQAKAVQELMRAVGFVRRETHKDFGGNDRVTIGHC